MVDVVVKGTVRAAPSEVFAFLADLANWPRWQSDMKATTLVEGAPGTLGAVYRYTSKAMGQTIDSTVRIVKVDEPREVAFKGEWAGMIRPSSRYLVEPAGEGTRVTLNPHPETRGPGSILAPLLTLVIRRLNRQHMARLQEVLGRG